MRCNQCDSLYINGLFCHETGCPNKHKVYVAEDDSWITEVDPTCVFCEFDEPHEH